MGDDRPSRYVEDDGTVVYRASSLGSCERALVALARGMTPRPHPEWFQEVLDEGSRFESVIRDKVNSENYIGRELAWADQVELNLEVMDGVIVRAHTDDLAVLGGKAYLREYKKFRPSTWGKFMQQGVECNTNYPWQVAAMWHALVQAGYEPQVDFIGGELDEAGKQIKQVVTKEILAPPIPLRGIIKKIARVEQLIADGYDPSEVPCIKSYPCGFWQLHDPEPEVEVHVIGPGANEVREAWAAWHTQHTIVKTAEAMLEAAKAKQKTAFEAIVAAAPTAKKFEMDGVVLTRISTTVEEKQITRAAYTTDYLKAAATKKTKGSDDG